MERKQLASRAAEKSDINDVYMGVLHVVFHRSWCDVSGVCKDISAKCETFLACEHEADDKVKTSHVHCLLHNFDSLNRIPVEGVRTFIPKEFKGRGQYVIMEKTEVARKYYKVDELSVYMIKGEEKCVRYVKNYSPVQLEALASKWIDHSVHAESNPDRKKEKTHWDIILDIVADIEPSSSSIQVGNKLLTSKRVSYDEVWYKTLKHLNANRIKTCKNDLERWLVSVMRVTQCDELRENLKVSIERKLFLN